MRQAVLSSIAALLTATAAAADPLPQPALPTLALDPAPPPSIWNGLYVGSEVVASASRGSKGLFGGGVYAGYDRAFANSIVLGVEGGTGFSPGWSSNSRFKSFDYGVTNLRVGYDMGRLMPFLTAGVALARPHLGPGEGTLGSESFNTLLNGAGDLQAATRIGVGATYAITNDLSVSVAVSAVNGRGLLLP